MAPVHRGVGRIIAVSAGRRVNCPGGGRNDRAAGLNAANPRYRRHAAIFHSSNMGGRREAAAGLQRALARNQITWITSFGCCKIDRATAFATVAPPKCPGNPSKSSARQVLQRQVAVFKLSEVVSRPKQCLAAALTYLSPPLSRSRRYVAGVPAAVVDVTIRLAAVHRGWFAAYP
jgi:hypothetical protein